MIIILKPNPEQERISRLIGRIKEKGLSVNYSEGSNTTIIGLLGDTSAIDPSDFEVFDIVERVQRVTEPFKQVNRKFHPEDTIIEVAGRKIGAGYFNVFSGPCSVESEDQILEVAESVKKAGASFVTEIMSEKHLDLFADVDIIQLGARNMQNFMLLKELGRSKKPILLKRGLSATMEEFLMAAEYIFAGGNTNVMLCERGIRTFETMIRNNLDISAVPLVKNLTHLPIIIDPSHAAGKRELVAPLSRAAIAAGADGLMIETHNNPKCALCDGAQSLNLPMFDEVMEDIKRRAAFEGRTLQ